MRRFLLLAALAMTCISGAARAADLEFVINQVGPDVVATGTGSLPNLLGLTALGSVTFSAGISPASPDIRIGNDASSAVYLATFSISGPLGSNQTTSANSGTGPLFGNSGTLLILPNGYVAGSQLNSTATWTNTTLAALGLTAGATSTITWNSGARSLSITVVPEPSTVITGLLSASVAVLAVRRRSRNRMPCESVKA